MFPSLDELCMNRIVDYLCEGKLPPTKNKWNEQLSNVIFKNFYEQFREITRKIRLELAEKLNVTKIRLNRSDLNENHCKMVYAHKLKELELVSLKYAKMFHISDTIDRRIFFDIIACLEQLLNPESQKTLQYLKIEGDKLIFPVDWLKELSKLTPSLQKLDIGGYRLLALDMRNLTEYFQQITELTITCSKLKNLDGIQRLQNLKVLKTMEADFEKKEDLMKLFELKKLEFLDISGKFHDYSRPNGLSAKSKTFKFYMECRRTLPNLEYLDCSFNEVSEETMKTFMRFHPKLRRVSLIGTTLASTVALQNNKVKLRTVQNLRYCTEALQYYAQSKPVPDQHHIIFDSINRGLGEYYEKQTEKNIRDCFQTVISAVKKHIENYKMQAYGVDCLWHFCRENRSQVLNFDEKQLIIDALLSMDRLQGSFRTDDISPTFVKMWKILNTDVIHSASQMDINHIHKCAANVVAQSGTVNHPGLRDCLEVLALILSKQKPAVPLSMRKRGEKKSPPICYHIESYLQSLVEIAFYTPDDVFDDEYFLLFLRVLRYSNKLTIHRVDRYVKRWINTFIQYLAQYRLKPRIQIEILKALEEMMNDRTVEGTEEFFEENNFMVLLNILSDNNTSRQESAVSLLVKIYFNAENKKTRIVKTQESKDQLINDILKSIDGYVAVHSSDMMRMFRLITSKSNSQETILWAEWILSHFDDDDALALIL